MSKELAAATLAAAYIGKQNITPDEAATAVARAYRYFSRVVEKGGVTEEETETEPQAKGRSRRSSE